MIGLLSGVDPHVLLEVVGDAEALVALYAFVRFFSSVDIVMSFQGRQTLELFAAHTAHDVGIRVVRSDVVVEEVGRLEDLPTLLTREVQALRGVEGSLVFGRNMCF